LLIGGFFSAWSRRAQMISWPGRNRVTLLSMRAARSTPVFVAGSTQTMCVAASSAARWSGCARVPQSISVIPNRGRASLTMRRTASGWVSSLAAGAPASRTTLSSVVVNGEVSGRLWKMSAANVDSVCGDAAPA